MGELDYQVALLLQHRFEQEHRSRINSEKSDECLARELQEQFESEKTTENPSCSLVYEKPKAKLNSSKCLTDPSWELVDPTPDIHALFVAFGQKFFWNKLTSVCVSWSKKMTSCAGICSYQGRGGMCSITLSEPLLKLRPRKDLVETLLHEMIHAYLFVTSNNRDRDGHGPEFHKHMFRINKESGTNITVYHNFHDEVRLYQQHWWRCNGPCQHRGPYFGMVRRATNRAPAPHDRWWADHARDCGGTFIKVKEPEKVVKGKKEITSKPSSSKGDIRKFLEVTSLSSSSTSSSTNQNPQKPKTSGASTGLKTGGSRTKTVVINKTKNQKSDDSVGRPTPINLNSVEENKKSGSASATSASYTKDFMNVRDHWQKKFGNTAPIKSGGNREAGPSKLNVTPEINVGTTKAGPSKRPSSSDVFAEKTAKSPRMSPTHDNVVPNNAFDFVECPICSEDILMVDLNSHLDSCLVKVEKPAPSTVIDLTQTPEKAAVPLVDLATDGCFEVLDGNGDNKTECLCCGKQISKADLNSHLDDCMSGFFSNSPETETDGDKSSDKSESIATDQFNCPFCLEVISEDKMKVHIDDCLRGIDKDAADLLTATDF